MKSTLLILSLSLLQFFVPATVLAAKFSIDNLEVIAKPGSFSGSVFVVAKTSAKSVQWTSAQIAGRQAYLTNIPLKDFGPAHLVKALTEQQAKTLKQTGSFPVVAFGNHPPHLVGHEFYIHFKINLFEIPSANIELLDKRTGLVVVSVDGNTYADPVKAEDFRQWDRDDRLSFYEMPTQRYANLISYDVKSTHPAFAKIEASFNEEVLSSYEVEYDDGMVLVGKPKVSISLVKHADGTVLGGQFVVRQEGAMYRDESSEDRPTYFDTMAKAEAAGAEDADVNWSANGTFEFTKDGSIVWENTTEGMEWTGH